MKIFYRVGLVSVCFLLSSLSYGAPITWTGGSLLGLGTTTISTTGALVEAHNTGASAAAIAVGGVAFDNIETSPLSNVFTGAIGGGALSGDASFDALLNSASYTNDYATENYIIDGLVNGSKYLVQFFSADNRTCCDLRTVTVDDLAGNTLTSGNLGDGYVFTGIFTAVGITQTVAFSGSDPQNSNPSRPVGYINGWQLRSVPEPSTLALLGLSLLGLGLSRRRQLKG